MRNILVLVFVLTGCATSNQLHYSKEDVVDSLQQDSYIEESRPNLPDWVYQVGLQNGNMISVGVAEGDASSSPLNLQRAAAMDAESQLFSSAPHEYREAVQNAALGTGVSEAQYQSVQSKLTRLTGVSGVVFPPSYSYCLKVARDTGDYIAVRRVCYQQAVAPVSAVNRTIERTFLQYYGGNPQEFQRRMKDEMDKLGSSTPSDQSRDLSLRKPAEQR